MADMETSRASVAVVALARRQAAAAARRQAEAAASRAGIEVRILSADAELRAASELLTELWGSPFSDHILRGLVLAGSYVAGAFDLGARPLSTPTVEPALVGASVAFAAVSPEPELHSHITGVLPSHRRSGVGRALKLHQRRWALENLIGTITWTFDPLVRRNAVFNLARLGATVELYIVNAYGLMNDAINGDDESDRFFLKWRLADPVVEAAAAGIAHRVLPPPLPAEGLRPGRDGGPRFFDVGDAERFSCKVPDDIESLRRNRPEVARAWRVAFREVMALAAGGRVLGLNEAGDYVVERGRR
jgi:predicted GNAT superfamily acetyltransferase